MNWETIRTRCESTPFVCVETPTGNIRLFWSKRAGTYGHQVYGFAIDMGAGEKAQQPEGRFYKTDACGFCKESQALHMLFMSLGYAPRGMRLGSEGVPHKYRVGGNYYRIPKRDWLKIKK